MKDRQLEQQLKDAAKRGDIHTVNLAITAGIDPNIGLSPAAQAGQVDVLRQLLDDKADVNNSAKDISPLTTAVRAGQMKAMEYLIEKKADVNSYDSPLMAAVQTDQVQAADYLLKHKADLHSSSNNDVLSTAVSQQNSLNMIRLLLDAKANDKDLIMDAVKAGRLNVVEELLSRNAGDSYKINYKYTESSFYLPDGEIRSKTETTMLLEAVNRGDEKMTEILLKAGAKPDIICSNQRSSLVTRKTALIVAIENGHVNIVTALLKHHANPNLRGVDNMMVGSHGDPGKVIIPLHLAITQCPYSVRPYVVRALLKGGANIESALATSMQGEYYDYATFIEIFAHYVENSISLAGIDRELLHDILYRNREKNPPCVNHYLAEQYYLDCQLNLSGNEYKFLGSHALELENRMTTLRNMTLGQHYPVFYKRENNKSILLGDTTWVDLIPENLSKEENYVTGEELAKMNEYKEKEDEEKFLESSFVDYNKVRLHALKHLKQAVLQKHEKASARLTQCLPRPYELLVDNEEQPGLPITVVSVALEQKQSNPLLERCDAEIARLTTVSERLNNLTWNNVNEKMLSGLKYLALRKKETGTGFFCRLFGYDRADYVLKQRILLEIAKKKRACELSDPSRLPVLLAEISSYIDTVLPGVSSCVFKRRFATCLQDIKTAVNAVKNAVDSHSRNNVVDAASTPSLSR